MQKHIKSTKIQSIKSRVENSFLDCPICNAISPIKIMTCRNCESIGTLKPELIGDYDDYLEVSWDPKISPKLTCIHCGFKKIMTNCPSCKKFVQLEHWHIGNK